MRTIVESVSGGDEVLLVLTANLLLGTHDSLRTIV